MKLSIRFEPRNLWVGVFWDYGQFGSFKWATVSLCILPTLTITLEVNWKETEKQTLKHNLEYEVVEDLMDDLPEDFYNTVSGSGG